MVARYWGEHGIFAEDFARLVDPQARGIRTAALTAALGQRGWDVVTFRGTARRIRRHLAQGQPVIVLIEDAPDRYHYLVVVGWVDSQIIVHDPARAPFRVLDMTTFVDAWAAADFWTLLMLPSGAPSDRVTTRTFSATADAGSGRCATAVSDAVSLAVEGALAQAETTLLEASARCPGDAAAVRELAGVRLLQHRWAEASALAREALTRDPHDDHARRVLATSTFVQDDPSGALHVWNHLDEPTIDLVEVHGLARTRHASVEHIVALPPRVMLTASGLARARRRLALLPTATASRISYRPHGGQADVAVTVTERPLVATDTAHLITAGVRAATKRAVRFDLASPTGNGEVWNAEWRWWESRPRLAFALDTPAPGSRLGAVWRIDASWERQTYTEAGRHSVSHESARRLGFTVRDYATGSTYWEATTGLDEWSGQGTYGSLGFRVDQRHLSDRLLTGLEVRGWTGLTGGPPFASGTLLSVWRSSTAQSGFVWTLRGALDAVSAAAPRSLWPGAGSGEARPARLRAHPLLKDGVLSTDRLHHRLASLTIEVERRWQPSGRLHLGVVAFSDSARGWGHAADDGTARVDSDVGVGIRVGVPGHRGRIRLDVARGLVDGAMATSIGWELRGSVWDQWPP